MISQKAVKPNIIFCFTDQQKATSLDLYNQSFSAIRARNLQRIADRGTVFEHAYCAYPLCIPSRISTFTGRYPQSSGFIGNGAFVAPGEDTVLERLKDTGYRTYLAGKDHCFVGGAASGRDRHPAIAAHYDEAFTAIHNDLQTPEILEALPRFLPFIHQSKACHTIWGAEVTPWTQEETITKVLTDKAIDFIDAHLAAHSDKPFFLHWGPPDPHEYYQVPPEYAAMFPPEEIVLPPNWQTNLSDKAEFVQFMHWFFTTGKTPPGEAEIRNLISIYLGMCALVDDELGRIIDHIESKGLMNDTIFVFSSDHGDMCGELGLAHKWNGLYEGMIRVPLVISAPGEKMKRGQRVGAPVSLVDFAATICELAGVPAPKGNQGRSLVELLEGRGTREFVFLESGIAGTPLSLKDTANFPDHDWTNATWHSCPYDPPHRWTGRCLGVRDQRYKLIVREGQASELYDLQTDPGETMNQARNPVLGTVLERLREALMQHVMRCAPNFRDCTGYKSLDRKYTPGRAMIFSGPIHPAWKPSLEATNSLEPKTSGDRSLPTRTVETAI